MDLITWPYLLRRGHTDNPAEGACAMDAINWLAHGRHGDAPECACPVIAAYVMRGNDEMPDEVRQRLLPFLHRIAGSRSHAHEAARLRVLVLAAVRVFVPRALDAIDLHERARQLRALPDDVTYTAARAAAVARAAPAGADAAARAAARAADAAARAADAADAAAARAAAAAAARAAPAGADAAARAAARAADAAARAADAAAGAAWNDYFSVLDQALDSGPQGEPWSADAVAAGTRHFERARAGTAVC
jgi:hypothetical protein